MIQRYVVLGVVWAGCTAAWMLLGATLLVRSGETSSALVNGVHQLWGPPLDQAAPTAQYTEQRPREERRVLHDASGRPYETTVQKMEDVSLPMPLVSTRARVSLALEHRQKGLLWFPTYSADFEGRYAVLNDTTTNRSVTVSFPLPAQGAIYDGFEVLDEKGQPIRAEVDGGSAHWVVSLPSSARHSFQVRYRTRGTSSWTYRPATPGSSIIRDFSLEIRSTARGIDFSAGSISPSSAGSEGRGWRGTW